MVALAEFMCLCVDAGDGPRLGQWWADVLGQQWQPHDGNGPARGEVRGPKPGQRILFLEVDQPKTVKHRVHLDIYATSLEDLERRGAVIVEPQQEGWRWTIMADPEGGEFCAFLRDELPAELLHGVVVDSKDPAAIARWWADIYDVPVDDNDGGWSTVEHAPGMPDFTLDFVPVPEPKTDKNRVHWDVRAADVDALVSRGATVLRQPDDEIDWTVMADPEGNEFCVFPPAS